MISKTRDIIRRIVPELFKKKEQRNADLKKKLEEEGKKKKEERKLKVKDYVSRGEKWYKEALAEQKKVIELKRQVNLRILKFRQNAKEIITFQQRPRLPL